MKDEFFSKFDFEGLVKDPKKSSRRQLQIIEAAIELLHKEGLENFSYDQLSKRCSIARSLIYHYFPTTTDLMIFASAFIRYKYQSFVLSQMAAHQNIVDLFSVYIRSALEWVDMMPKESAVWLIYFHQCSISPALSAHNRKLVDMGTARIEAMLLAGIEGQLFALERSRVSQTARTLQIIITGYLVSRASETRTREEWQSELDSTVETCLSLVR